MPEPSFERAYVAYHAEPQPEWNRLNATEAAWLRVIDRTKRGIKITTAIREASRKYDLDPMRLGLLTFARALEARYSTVHAGGKLPCLV